MFFKKKQRVSAPQAPDRGEDEALAFDRASLEGDSGNRDEPNPARAAYDEGHDDADGGLNDRDKRPEGSNVQDAPRRRVKKRVRAASRRADAREESAGALDSSSSSEADRRSRANASFLKDILNPPPPAPGLAYAGIWRRFAAFLIDFPLSLVVAVAAQIVVQAALPRSWALGGLLPVLAMFIAQILYFVAFEASSWKATPGKRLFKLRVIDKRGQRITRLRSAARLIVALPFAFFIVGVLMIAVTRKRQSMADRITSTLVVRKTSESFLPSKLKAFELPVAIATSVVLSFLATEGTARVMLPVIDVVTLRMAAEASLKIMVPAQRAVEEAVSKERKLPAKLPDRLVGYSTQGFPHSIAYNPSSGTVTLWFMSSSLKGRGVSLTPTMPQAGGSITWECASINMDSKIAPGVCAPSKN